MEQGEKEASGILRTAGGGDEMRTIQKAGRSDEATRNFHKAGNSKKLGLK